jgi:hypothetical protein
MTISNRVKSVSVAFLAVTVLAAGVAAQSQLQLGGSSANFGVHNLAPGFVPDPKVISVTSGGSIDASTLGLGADCGGWVTRRPDAIVHLSDSSDRLRFFVRGNNGGDTTLLVNDGSGNWHCNDDSANGNLNPLVDIANAPAGQYDVWIGSYARDEQIGGTLNVTELDRRP